MVARGWGRVVNMASIAGKDGNPGLAAYSASKAGVIGLTNSLGKELATSGVLVNAVAPAVIETPMNALTSDEVLARLTSLIPMRRLGRAEEVAELISWLASERCSFSIGAVYDISGQPGDLLSGRDGTGQRRGPVAIDFRPRANRYHAALAASVPSANSSDARRARIRSVIAVTSVNELSSSRCSCLSRYGTVFGWTNRLRAVALADSPLAR